MSISNDNENEDIVFYINSMVATLWIIGIIIFLLAVYGWMIERDYEETLPNKSKLLRQERKSAVPSNQQLHQNPSPSSVFR